MNHKSFTMWGSGIMSLRITLVRHEDVHFTLTVKSSASCLALKHLTHMLSAWLSTSEWLTAAVVTSCMLTDFFSVQCACLTAKDDFCAKWWRKLEHLSYSIELQAFNYTSVIHQIKEFSEAILTITKSMVSIKIFSVNLSHKW